MARLVAGDAEEVVMEGRRQAAGAQAGDHRQVDGAELDVVDGEQEAVARWSMAEGAAPARQPAALAVGGVAGGPARQLARQPARALLRRAQRGEQLRLGGRIRRHQHRAQVLGIAGRAGHQRTVKWRATSSSRTRKRRRSRSTLRPGQTVSLPGTSRWPMMRLTERVGMWWMSRAQSSTRRRS